MKKTLSKKIMLTVIPVSIILILLTGIYFIVAPCYNEVSGDEPPAGYPYLLETAKRPAILMYHSISDTKSNVTAKNFEKQIKYLADNGYTFLFPEEIRDSDMYDKPIIITFDDGYDDNYHTAFEILKKYNAKATIFMITDSIGKEGFLSGEQIRELEDSGLVRVESHSHNHTVMSQQTPAHVRIQMERSIEALREITGRVPGVIAYPFGEFNDGVKDIAAQYYHMAVAASGGSQRDIMALYRIGVTNRCMLFNMRAFKKHVAVTYPDYPSP